MEKELLNVSEISEFLGVSQRTLLRWVKIGLPVVVIDFGRRRFLKGSVLSWLKKQEVPNVGSPAEDRGICEGGRFGDPCGQIGEVLREVGSQGRSEAVDTAWGTGQGGER